MGGKDDEKRHDEEGAVLNAVATAANDEPALPRMNHEDARGEDEKEPWNHGGEAAASDEAERAERLEGCEEPRESQAEWKARRREE